MAGTTPTNLELSKPLTLKCGLTLPNRLVKAAMAEGLGDSNGLPTDPIQDVYRKWADGGWGMILTGNVQTDANYLGTAKDVFVDTLLPGATTLAAFTKYARAAKTTTTTTPDATKTPVIVQISHPGRQSPLGAGRRSILSKSVAPSAIPMDMGGGFLARQITSLLFGTPRELTLPEIQDIIARFAHTARVCAEAGFDGVEIHAAHGYLLAQFLSGRSNKRGDGYGGDAEGRARIVVEIVKAVREATREWKGFAVGVKMNSVDHDGGEGEMEDCLRQLRCVVEAGVDFVEVSGGSYENPTMSYGPGGNADAQQASSAEQKPSARTQAREAFFLEFAATIRSEFRDVPLMVTGGFRSRTGMESAVASGDCDMVGIGRPAVLNPHLPLNTVFNPEIKDQDATLYAKKIPVPALIKWIGIRAVGAGVETNWYGAEMKNMIKV